MRHSLGPCLQLMQVSINSRKGDVEAELAVVAPLIEAARTAVGQIKADHLNEIRSLKAPPDAIRDVLEGVLKLMGQADTSWNSMKKFLGGRGIKVLPCTSPTKQICSSCDNHSLACNPPCNEITGSTYALRCTGMCCQP